MSSAGNIWVALRLRDQATRQLKGSLSSMRSSMLKFAAGFGAFNFIKEGLKQQSDFVENWSIVANSAGTGVQAAFQNAFKGLKRVTKAEAAGIAATITGTLKSKGVSDSMIAQLGPKVIQRLEDTGAFFNRTTQEVEHAFTSMISGMARPIEMLTRGAVVPLVANLDRLAESQFGVKFEKLAPDQQTLLRLQFFMDGTAKIPFLVGNSAATIGTFKGQLDATKKSLKDTSASIAVNLMPTLIKLMQILEFIVKAIDKTKVALGVFFGMLAGIKIVKFLNTMRQMIMAFYALAVAKAGSQGGIFALATAGAVAVGLGAVLGGIAGGMFFGGGSGGGSSSTTAAAPGNAGMVAHINIETSDPDIRINGGPANSGGNYGRGGS